MSARKSKAGEPEPPEATPIPPTPEHRAAAAQAQFLCGAHDRLAERLGHALVALKVIPPEGLPAFVQNEAAATTAALQQIAVANAGGGTEDG